MCTPVYIYGSIMAFGMSARLHTRIRVYANLFGNLSLSGGWQKQS